MNAVYLQKQFINRIGARLRNFKWKDGNLCNFSCPYCGDSQRKTSKARGFLYVKAGEFRFKCHNCGMTANFNGFLKHIDGTLTREYNFERFRSGEVQEAVVEPKPAPTRKPNPALLERLLDRCDLIMNPDHKALRYLRSRRIPESQWHRIFYADDVRKMEQLSEKYREKLTCEEDRLVLPFFNLKKQLVGATCRSFDKNAKLRYMTVRVREDEPFIFGLECVDFREHVYVVEGPIDSLFLPNCIAVSGIDMQKAFTVLDRHKTTFILDNQPRNKHVVRQMNDLVDGGWAVCVWENGLTFKDINDMVMNGVKPRELQRSIDARTFSGLKAKSAICFWKR